MKENNPAANLQKIYVDMNVKFTSLFYNREKKKGVLT